MAVVLGDALCRMSALGCREGMPRSLGSVYGWSVTRFLGGALLRVKSRVIDTRSVKPCANGLAVRRDGRTLSLSDSEDGSHAIHEFDVASGSRLRVVGGRGDGPLQFNCPRQVFIAPDDFVFVADCRNRRVQVLTPTLDFHGFVGAGQLSNPGGVCANADVVVVSDAADRITVFNRRDGALLRQFGTKGRGDGQLKRPAGLCFMRDARHFAVADNGNRRLSVFSVDGEFIRHVGAGVLHNPNGVVRSAFDELVVADSGNFRVAVLSASGELLKTMGGVLFLAVALHGGTIFAQSFDHGCVVYE
jgi:DNA-binding beta-propeller fold protein YncE